MATEIKHGLAFLDPAGDTAEQFLRLIPEHRVQDCIYFNPGDREYPPALNVLEASDQREKEMLASELLTSLKRLFRGSAEFGPRMEWILRMSIRSLILSDGQKTLRDIPRLLSDEAYRGYVLESISDPDILDFWNRVFSRFPPSAVDPILNRLSHFLDDPVVRNVVCQPNLIDFHEILREGKILVCNLSKGILGEEAATLLGSFILSRLQLAAMARAEIPPHERQLFPIIVDEFQNYGGVGSDTSSIRSFLSEARKYRVPLVLGTQFLSQLDRDVATAIFGNAGTLIALRCGVVDAQVLQRELGDFTTEDLLDLETGHALVRMGPAADAFNLTIPESSIPERGFRDDIISHSRTRFCRSASEVDLMLRRENEFSEDKSHRDDADESSHTTLTLEQRQMLEYLVENPDEPVSSLYRALKVGVQRGNRIRKELLDIDMIVEVETRMGKGNRPAVFLVPTIGGFQAINRPPLSGRGGVVHRHFQDSVARQSRSLGYEVKTEYRLENGGSVDVHLCRDDITIAVEIGIHSRPQREYKNIRKCLDAGYKRVFGLYIDPRLLKETQSLFLESASEEEKDRVTFCEVRAFTEELR